MKALEKKKKRWAPKNAERYYYVDASWYSPSVNVAYGNKHSQAKYCFKTQTQARQAAAAIRKILKEVL